MGRQWNGQYRGMDARISCMHHPKKVRTWQAHRSLALPVDAQHISIGLCMAQDGAAGIWSPSALASAELAAIASKLGHIPTVAEYHEAMGIVNKDGAAIYKYMNFNQIDEYVENAKGVTA